MSYSVCVKYQSDMDMVLNQFLLAKLMEILP